MLHNQQRNMGFRFKMVMRSPGEIHGGFRNKKSRLLTIISQRMVKHRWAVETIDLDDVDVDFRVTP